MAIDTLQSAVQSTLSAFLQHRLSTNDDLHADVYRTIRDVANLLLEKQLVCEAFDKDPFELMTTRRHGDDGDDGADAPVTGRLGVGKGAEEENDDLDEEVADEDHADDKDNHDDDDDDDIDDDLLEKKKNAELIARVKASLHVVSCSRVATPDGYSSIHAVLQFNNDDDDKNDNRMLMQGVENNVRLHFKFVREPQHQTEDESNPTLTDDSDDDVEVLLADSDGCARRDGSSNDVKNERQHDKKPSKKRKRTTNDTIRDKGSTEEEDVDENNNGSRNRDDPMDTTRNEKFTPKTIITYKIDYSVDFGKMKRLLGVDIYALDEHPSLEPAIPLQDEDAVEQVDEESNNMKNSVDGKIQRNDKITSTGEDDIFEEVEMSDNGDDNDDSQSKGNNSSGGGGDRFGVYINPENVVAFLDRTNLNLNDRSVFYFLLTFPFYEYEWEIPGFVFDALFDDEDDDDDDEDDAEQWNIRDEPRCLPCSP